jgi:hypothetical protein
MMASYCVVLKVLSPILAIYFYPSYLKFFLSTFQTF